MEIVGRGFLAGHLQAIANRHNDVVVLAAGVSAASDTSHQEFAREAELLYEVANKCEHQGKRLVFFSTAATGMYSVLGTEEGRENGPVFPATPYGRHKLALEAVLASTTTDHLILRLGHVVGANQRQHQLLPAIVAQLRCGVVRLHRGAQRDLIDVADVVAALDALLKRELSREVVNVASGSAVPISDIVDHIERLLGVEAQRHCVNASGAQPVSIEKLCALVPEFAEGHFGPDYYQRVLNKYVHTYTPQLAA